MLPALMQRISSQITELEAFSAAPSEAELHQIAVVKVTLTEAGKKVEAMRQQVAQFNDALNAAKVPFIALP